MVTATHMSEEEEEAAAAALNSIRQHESSNPQQNIEVQGDERKQKSLNEDSSRLLKRGSCDRNNSDLDTPLPLSHSELPLEAEINILSASGSKSLRRIDVEGGDGSAAKKAKIASEDKEHGSNNNGGEIRDGRPHGIGTMVYNDQMLYTGQWKTGERMDQGTWKTLADDNAEKEELIAEKEVIINELRQTIARLTNENTTPNVEAAAAQRNDTQVADPQPEEELQITPTDGSLTLPAGSLIQYSYQVGRDGMEIKDFAIINRDAQGNIVFEPTDDSDGSGSQMFCQPLAICDWSVAGRGEGYRAPDQASGDAWYQRNKIDVQGSLCKKNLLHLYRIICDSTDLYRIICDSKLVRHRRQVIHNFIIKCVFESWKEPGDHFYLSDYYQPDANEPDPVRILDTTEEGLFWLRHLIPDETYFRPITFSETNVFVITAAYDLLHWFDQPDQDHADSKKKIHLFDQPDQDHADSKEMRMLKIKKFIEATPDPLTGSTIRVASVLAYSFALIRLFATVSHKGPIMKTLNCICCSEKKDDILKVPVGLQTFVLPALTTQSYNNILLPECKYNGRDLYNEHNKNIMGAATGSGNITVDAFLTGRRKLKIQDIDGADKAMLGFSVAIYMYLGDRESSFLSVVDHLAAMPLNQPELAPKLKTAIDSCCKKGTKLTSLFGGERLQLRANIVIKFAMVLSELSSDAVPDWFEKAFKLAMSNSNLFDNDNPRDAFNSSDDVVLEPKTDKQVQLLKTVREWGEKVHKVDRVRQLVNDPSVSLYLAIKQLGPLQRFFYGPLVPMAMFEKTNNGLDVHKMLEKFNLQPYVAVDPAIGEELFQMARTAFCKYGITTSKFDPFIKVNLSQTVELSDPEVNEAFLNFIAAYGLQVPSFQYSAAMNLFDPTKHVNDSLANETGNRVRESIPSVYV